MRLQDKVILITGSTTGIGQAIAVRALAEGARVVIHGRDAERGRALVEQHPDQAELAIADLADPAAAPRLIETAVNRFGRLDALVNNAAWIGRSDLASTDAAVFDKAMAVNVRAPMLLVKAAVEHLKQSHGCVLNIGSINAYTGESNLLAYSISKGALMTLSRNLADALCYDGVRVNHFNVGWVLTPNEYKQKLADGLPEGWPEKVDPQFAPSGRILRPEEIAAAAVYWLSDESRPISGSVVELEQYPIIGRNPHQARRLMPRLAAFPKAFMDELCVRGAMTIRGWIELAASLDLDGLEFYTGFLELRDPAQWSASRRLAADHGLAIPMLCCSPDFTHHDADFRQRQIEQQKEWIERCAELGGQFCRVLSGQRRPEVDRDDGIRYAAESIAACLPTAIACGVTLTIENHYKDNYWQYPEFVQRMDDFTDLVGRIDSPSFGVNYDPSNALLAGDDPIELLRRVKHRVVTMHASDRYLAVGTLDDLRREENSVGYASRLRHGVIGRGLIDYDAVFGELTSCGFDGWISIEDGVDGMDQLRESVQFLRRKIGEHWLASLRTRRQPGTAK